jgi:hypothetical protein
MKPTVFLRAISATAVFALAAKPVAAQTPAQAGQPAASANAVAPTPWPARPLGRYELEIQLPDKLFPGTVVIADSSGTPAAIFQGDGDPETHPLKITVKDTELFLNAVSPQGPVELVLIRRGDLLSGRWQLGEGKGELKGKVDK